jgi:hypothetical protein
MNRIMRKDFDRRNMKDKRSNPANGRLSLHVPHVSPV